MPIVARNGAVFGTFGTYFRECHEPTADERCLVAVLVCTAAIAIERERMEETRRAQTEALQEAMERPRRRTAPRASSSP